MTVKYLSNKVKDLQVGITNYSENKPKSLYVVGNVGIGTTNPTAEVGISNTSVLAVGILTAYRIFSSVYGEFTGAFSGGTVDTNSLNVTGISTLGTVKVSGGIVTATAGVVTYFGDGSNLTGIAVTEHTDTRSLNVSGLSTFGGNIDANGDLDVDGQTNLDDLVVTGGATFNNTVTLSSLLDCNGGADIDTLTAATAKISDLTQNRVVIAGANGELADNANLTYASSTLNVGTNLNVVGSTTSVNLTVTGFSTFTGPIDCNSGGDISGSTLNVSAGLIANSAQISDLTDNRIVIVGTGGELEDTTKLTFDGSTFAVTGDATFSGAIDANGGADISGGETILSSATVSDLTDNRVVLAGTSGALEDTTKLTFDGTTLAVVGDATFTGNVSIAGTLTKEDVTNIDSVGLVTARSGVRITSGGLVVSSGVSTFTDAIDANGSLTASSAKVSDLTINRVVTVGASGELQDSSNLGYDGTKLTTNGLTVNGNLFLPNSGNHAGIGTASKLGAGTDSLSVYGNSVTSGVRIWASSATHKATSVPLQVANSSGVELFRVHGDGNIGIGIANPSEKLDVSGNIKSSGNITVSGDINANGNIIGDAATNISGINSVTAATFFGSGLGLTDLPSGGLWVANSAGIHTTVDVGIGTTNPSDAVNPANTKKLSVGIVSAYELYVNNIKYVNDLNVTGVSTLTGNTFVGSAIAMYASTGIVSATSFYGEGSNLTDVSWGSVPGGSSFITEGSQTAIGGDAGDWNVIAGYFAGCCVNDNTDYNTILGESAGRKLVNGDRNVFIGSKAGCGNTDGTRNTFIGECAATESTTGDYNIGIGYKTLKTNTGSCNIAIGQCASEGSTSGENNVVIGKSANSDVGVGGTDNVWIGTYSGGYASGCCNTFIGAQSGYGVYNGTFNIGLGFEAGYSTMQQTAHYNISIGAKAGLTGTTGSCNVFLGVCAGRAVTTGDFNLFAGHKAGDAVTVGACNVYLGNLAGAGSTAGERNIAVGQCAGYSNKTGSYNISFGSCAGYTNETGTNNVFVGKDAGKVSTASNNTFIGSSSGSKVTSGDSNVFFGPNSGLEATTSGCNIFIGRSAGQGDSGQPIIGGCNIALGAFSGNELKDGTDNLFLGTRAGKITDDGVGNVFLGYYAGSANGSGNCNVFIGNQAGDTNTTGNNNIAIGYNVELPNVSTNCQFAIGSGTDRWIAGDSNFNTTLAGIVTAYSSGIVSATSYYGDGSNLTNIGGGTLISGITIKEEGSTVGVAGSIKTLDFVGDTVTATASGTTATITIAGAGSTSGWIQDAQGNLVAGDGAGAARDADTCTNIMVGCNAGNAVDSGDYNTFLGCGAGEFVTGGHSNVAIGCSAGQNLSSSVAFHQVFIGSGAGMNATCINSKNGVAIGYKAGCTQVCYDVFIGCGAGRSNETGKYNVFLGADVGTAVTTGTCNLMIGRLTGSNMTSGNDNVFLGHRAGQCVTSSCKNIFIGDYTVQGQGAAIGDSNIVIGGAAGADFGATARCNVVIGAYAAYEMTGGCDNIAIGQGAGYSIAGGSYNTFLGHYSGCTTTSGSDNVTIGKRVTLPSATGSNQFAIGCCNSHWITGDANFNVGIGTNTTAAVGIGITAKLSVGIVSAYQLYGDGSNLTNVGAAATDAWIPDAQENLVAGNGAGARRDSDTSWNILIGCNAGAELDSGDTNVFIGHEAGRCFTSGYTNIALGYKALFGSWTDTNNSGTNNIAMGSHAAKLITSGIQNVIMGWCAGFNVTTQSNSVFMGRNAGFYRSTGEDNFAFGCGALQGSSTVANNWGVGNVAIGHHAGKDVTCGANNILLGCRAGKSVTSGCHNIILGKYAACNITTGTGNVALGYCVELPSATGNNQLVIGAAANTWINGDANFNVGIGTNRHDTVVGAGVTAKLSVGIVSAYQLYGDGSTLVGVAKSTVLEDAGINTSGTTTLNHFVVTGISTFGNNISVTGTASASDFNSTSDIRLKTNIKRIEDPLAKVVRIEGVTFDWKEWNRPALGVIADQVEEVIPELVQGTDPKTVNYNGLIGLLIEAVKEQQIQIDDLNSRLSKLE